MPTAKDKAGGESRTLRRAARRMARSLKRHDRIARLETRLAAKGLSAREQGTLDALRAEDEAEAAMATAAVRAELERLRTRQDAFREALGWTKPTHPPSRPPGPRLVKGVRRDEQWPTGRASGDEDPGAA